METRRLVGGIILVGGDAVTQQGWGISLVNGSWVAR